MDERRDPWRSDLAALDERTRLHAPSLERTVSLVLASATPHTHKEKTMNRIKRRPALVALIVLAAVAALTPVAYAVANQIFLSIDPDQPDEQIAEDVRQQLVAAGVDGAEVRAIRDQERLLLDIEAGEHSPLDLAIGVRDDGHPATARTVRFELDVRSDLTPAQRDALTRTMTDPAMLRLHHERPEGRSDAQVAAAMRDFLVARGYPDAAVAIRGDAITLTIVTAPTAPAASR